jgi:hypothetical protein
MKEREGEACRRVCCGVRPGPTAKSLDGVGSWAQMALTSLHSPVLGFPCTDEIDAVFGGV